MAATLKPYGYTYVDIDAGWASTWAWAPEYDSHGRPAADPARFPHGMAYVADHIHALGLRAGIYLTVGLDKVLYERATTRSPARPDAGSTTSSIRTCGRRTGGTARTRSTSRIPARRPTWTPRRRQLADWGYDLLKLDGVGPGSGKTDPRHDNTADVKAWHSAIAKTGRPIQLVLSWALNPAAIQTWRRYADGWRVDDDVECYCDTLVQWNKSVVQRFDDVPGWARLGGPKGWNNLDSLDVGNGELDGLTDDERRSYVTLWAISAAPLYTGDDMTSLDPLGLELLTNRDVLAIDAAGRAAAPVTPHLPQQVWRMRNADGTWTVALFNLGPATARVSVRWSDIGFTGPADVHDVWATTDLGKQADGFTADVPSHGTRLLRVDPR